MHVCGDCEGKTFKVIKKNDEKAREYRFIGYRGRVYCIECAKKMGIINDGVGTAKRILEGIEGLAEETYINPS